MSDPKFETNISFATRKNDEDVLAIRARIGRYYPDVPEAGGELFCDFETCAHYDDADDSAPFFDFERNGYGAQLNLHDLRALKRFVSAALETMEAVNEEGQ